MCLSNNHWTKLRIRCERAIRDMGPGHQSVIYKRFNDWLIRKKRDIGY